MIRFHNTVKNANKNEHLANSEQKQIFKELGAQFLPYPA